MLSAFAPIVHNGRSMRTYTVIKALAALGPVDVAYVPFEAGEPSDEYRAIEGASFTAVPASRGATRLATYARLRLQRFPGSLAKSVSPELLRAAQDLGTQPGRGLVVATDLASMISCLPLARHRPVAFVAHNVESSYAAGSGEAGRERDGIRRLEARIFGAVREAWMASRRDVEIARELVPGGRFRYVPNVVDLARIAPAPSHPRPAPRREVLMVGDHTYPPNADGARWLVEQVMPLVRARIPDARLTLVGRAAETIAAPGPGLELRGFVDDLAAAYHAADVVAVPLLDGGGSPLKFVEALAYGVPVVATPVAARGLELDAGRHFRLGDDAEGFAAELEASLRGDDSTMAAAARAHVEADHSVQTLVRLLTPVAQGGL